MTTKPKPPSKAKVACALVDDAIARGELELFTSVVDETPYATLERDGHSETYALKGGGFSKYLRLAYWDLAEDPLHGESLTAALAHAEMRAMLGERRELHARVAHLGDSVIVDAGDDRWGAYRITAGGWEYIDRHPVPFVRSKGTNAFAAPDKGRALLPLLIQILGVEPETAMLLAAWTVCTFCAGPYIVLVLHGEQGSGKSTAAKVVRFLTDPSAVPLRTPPRESRDLIVAARGSHVLAYDNLSAVPQWLSDALSMIATGGGYEARQLYTDLDEVLVRLKRPILLNGIENPAVSADLLDRSLVVALKPIEETTRRSEEEIDADVSELAGELVGATFDAISAALEHLPDTERPGWARMVDATRWALAAAPALGTPEAPDTTPLSVEEILKSNRARRDELVLEGSVFATAVIEFAIARTAWEGTTAELKSVLETETETGKANAEKREIWPGTIQKVVALLAREAPILRRQGVEWTDSSRRAGIKVKTLTYRAPEGAERRAP